MRRWRRNVGLFLLGVVTSPWTCAALGMLHASDHSHDLRAHERRLDALNMVTHGHDHDAETPVHEHSVTASTTASTTALAPPSCLPSAVFFMMPVLLAPQRARGGGAPVGHDPPAYSGAPTLLRI